jgi:LysR family transcriptional activator of nhaA
MHFWTVAKEGSMAAASKALMIGSPTLSTQIKELERNLGEDLFTREGRRLELTEMGKVVFDYAEEIFSLGKELLNAVKQRPTGKPQRLRIGVTNAVPKMAAFEIIQYAFKGDHPTQVVCREAELLYLVSELASFRLDMIISDAPAQQDLGVEIVNHDLGESGITFFSNPSRAAALKRGFPRSLDGAPMLLPTTNSPLRNGLEHWFNVRGIAPRVLGEFEDSALLKVFASAGIGVFAGHTFVAEDICRYFAVERIGETEEVRDRFYVITAERRVKHPALLAIIEAAKSELFER